MSNASSCPQGHPVAVSDKVCPVCGARCAAMPTLSDAVADTDVLPPLPVTMPVVPGYDILGELGRGGMGVVYKAKHLALNRVVALKMIRERALAGPEELARFRAEAEVVAHLQHPNIIQVHEVGAHLGNPYFCLEFVNGGNLAERLRGKPLPARSAALLTETLARAIHASHQRNILHRDLKPANVLLQVAEDKAENRSELATALLDLQSVIPKITDFGLAMRLGDSDGLTRSGEVLGTPSYMAPEQALGRSRSRPAGPAIDVYALGAILYEMLTGRPPFLAESPLDTLQQLVTQDPVPPSRLQSKVPHELETICLKCLHKDPRHRYSSALALAEDLRCFLEDMPIQARPAPLWERAGRLCRRNPLASSLTAALLLLFFISFAIVTAKWLEASWEKDQKEQARLEADAHAKSAREQAAVAEEEKSKALTAQKTAEAAESKAAQEAIKEAEARRKADDARNDADASNLRLRRALYVSAISLAQREWEGNNIARAGEILAGCSQEARGWEWHYLNRLCNSRLRTLIASSREVNCLAISPDGQRLAVGVQAVYHVDPDPVFSGKSPQLPKVDKPGEIRVLDFSTGRLLQRFEDKTGGVGGLAFSPDGNALASTAKDLRLWDMTTGQERLVIKGSGNAMFMGVAFSPDGKTVAAAAYNGVVGVWDSRTGNPVQSWSELAIAYRVAFSEDGQMLAVTGEARQPPGELFLGQRRRVMIWDPRTGQRRLELIGGDEVVSFSPDGRWVAAGYDQEASITSFNIRIWDVATGKAVHTLEGHTLFVKGLAFSPDGKLLASCAWDGTTRLWDPATGKSVGTMRAESGGGVEGLAFAPRGGQLASVVREGTVSIWNIKATPEAYTLPTGRIAFSPDGRRLARAWETTLSLHDTATGKEQVSWKATGGLWGPAFSPDGQRLLILRGDNTVAVFGAETGVQELVPKNQEGGWGGNSIWGAAFSPDGKLIAAANIFGTVTIWDAKTGAEVRKFPSRDYHGLLFSPDSMTIFLVTREYIRQVRLADGKEVREFRLAPEDWNNHHAALSQDGKWLAAATGRKIMLWNITGLAEPRVLRAHLANVQQVAFHPDGRLASASKDTTVKLWDLATGDELLTLRGHTNEVFQIAFNRDGGWLATSSWSDKTVRLWNGTKLLGK